MSPKYTVLAGLFALAACTTAADVSKPLAEGRGNDAKIKVADTATGFSVDVRYSRYQFIPETEAVLTACRSIATARAYEEAKKRDREIQPINELNRAGFAGGVGL